MFKSAPPPSLDRRRRYHLSQMGRALWDVLPMLVGTFPFGILYGLMARDAELTFWQSQGISLIVFAGSAQFLAITLLSAGSAIGTCAIELHRVKCFTVL